MHDKLTVDDSTYPIERTNGNVTMFQALKLGFESHSRNHFLQMINLIFSPRNNKLNDCQITVMQITPDESFSTHSYC